MVETTGVNRTLCAPRRPAFHDISLHVSPIPGRLTAIETTQPPPASLWCAVYVWALRGGLHLSTACGAKLLVSTAPCVCIDARLPNALLLVSPLPRHPATVESTQCNRRPTPITLQTFPLLKSPGYFPNLPIAGPVGQDGAGLARGVQGFSSSAALPTSSTSRETGSSKGPKAEGAMPGGFPCPDVGRASQEADAKSARMPRKRKADDEGF
jgi:hypothetical protein